MCSGVTAVGDNAGALGQKLLGLGEKMTESTSEGGPPIGREHVPAPTRCNTLAVIEDACLHCIAQFLRRSPLPILVVNGQEAEMSAERPRQRCTAPAVTGYLRSDSDSYHPVFKA